MRELNVSGRRPTDGHKSYMAVGISRRAFSYRANNNRIGAVSLLQLLGVCSGSARGRRARAAGTVTRQALAGAARHGGGRIATLEFRRPMRTVTREFVR